MRTRTIVATATAAALGAGGLGAAAAAGLSAAPVSAPVAAPAAASLATSGTSGTSGSSSRPLLTCAAAPRILARIQKVEGRISTALPKLQAAEQQAQTSGNSTQATKIQNRIDRLDKMQQRLGKVTTKIDTRCPGATPTTGGGTAPNSGTTGGGTAPNSGTTGA